MEGIDTGTVIAVVATLAFLLTGVNTILKPIRKDIAKLETGQAKLEAKIDTLLALIKKQ